MFTWNKWTWLWLLAAALGMAMMYCQPIKVMGQNQPEVLVDSHANPPGNVRSLSPHESPLSHDFSFKTPPKKPAAPSNPRLVIHPANEPAKDRKDGKQTD